MMEIFNKTEMALIIVIYYLVFKTFKELAQIYLYSFKLKLQAQGKLNTSNK
jgi:hypothetical protein